MAGAGSLVRGNKDPIVGAKWSGDAWPAVLPLLLSVVHWDEVQAEVKVLGCAVALVLKQ